MKVQKKTILARANKTIDNVNRFLENGEKMRIPDAPFGVHEDSPYHTSFFAVETDMEIVGGNYIREFANELQLDFYGVRMVDGKLQLLFTDEKFVKE